MNIVIIGFTASGKSSAAKCLARMSGWGFIDTDDLVEKIYAKEQWENLSCRQIYARHGENYFRKLETKALQSLKNSADMVIATGGGIILPEENLPLLRELGTCVFLDTPLQLLQKRLGERKKSRLFAGKDIEAVYKKRLPKYLEAANLCYAVTEDMDKKTVACGLFDSLQKKLGQIFRTE